MRLKRLKWGLRQDARRNDTPHGPPSVVARDLLVSGHVECTGEVHIHGAVNGDICAGRIVLGSDGFVDGDLIAEEVVVQGRLRGRVTAFTVIVEETAILQGNIFHHELTVADGAHLDGMTPWRPVNYFENITKDLKGVADDYVHAG